MSLVLKLEEEISIINDTTLIAEIANAQQSLQLKSQIRGEGQIKHKDDQLTIGIATNPKTVNDDTEVVDNFCLLGLKIYNKGTSKQKIYLKPALD